MNFERISITFDGTHHDFQERFVLITKCQLYGNENCMQLRRPYPHPQALKWAHNLFFKLILHACFGDDTFFFVSNSLWSPIAQMKTYSNLMDFAFFLFFPKTEKNKPMMAFLSYWKHSQRLILLGWKLILLENVAVVAMH